MCGIIVYLGNSNAALRLYEGIEHLHYRGYDSSGIATILDRGTMLVCKQPDKNLEAFREKLVDRPYWGTTGIGHTRWATHGNPSEANAHPQLSPSGRIAVVHNGTVDNFIEIVGALASSESPPTFRSETDTEVIAILIEQALAGADSLEEAVRQALLKIIGPFAVAVISADEPHKIVAARNGSPLHVGHTLDEQEWFVASDAAAFARRARTCTPLEDGEIAVVCRGRPLAIYDLNRAIRAQGDKKIAGRARVLEPAEALSTKDGHPHFMRKEMFEAPSALRNAMRGRLRHGNGGIKIGALDDSDVANRLRDAERIIALGCGTSLRAAEVGKLLIERFAGIPVEAIDAAAWRYGAGLVSSRHAAVLLSQSGETKDLLEALQRAQSLGALTFAITNRVGSELAVKAKRGMYLHAGPEVAVASTKAFTCQVGALALLACRLAQMRRYTSPDRIHALLQALEALPEQLTEMLQLEGLIRSLAGMYAHASCIPIIGNGFNTPVAREGELKLMEVAYCAGVHGFAGNELKHGPIALLEEGTPVIVIAPHDGMREKTLGNVSEALARGANIIALTTRGDEELYHLGPRERIHLVPLPETAEELYPIPAALLLQLFAYHMGVLRGIDVDKPRNLAKSVTV